MEYGLFIIIEDVTNIIVTIIEMEWRKHRNGINKIQKKYNMINSIIPVAQPTY
jgi:hypothetical protein